MREILEAIEENPDGFEKLLLGIWLVIMAIGFVKATRD